uniref:MADF domain-containing protein n=1 Tax=Cuerna arida TaxID=1464854 RepID=A0A1B6F583_9HEMI
MFVIKYDKVSMIKLVQSIEKYPALYNTKKHFSKDEVDSAWDKVATSVGEKDSLCRDRWHSIKSCYIRHLKYTALNSKRRPYYLAEYLDFMVPFVSDRVKKFLSLKQNELGSLPSYLKDALPPMHPMNSYLQQNMKHDEPEFKTEVVEIEEVEEEDEEDVEEEEEEVVMEKDWMTVGSENQQPSSSKVLSRKSTSNDTSSSTPKKIKLSTESDEDINFFKSLLPDVARMSSHQKLKFKQEALSIIEDILYATDEINITT